MLEFPQTLAYCHFEQMFDLECLYYSEEFITPADEAWRWYVQHPHSVVVALHGDAVAGFVNLFPINLELFDEIRVGRFNDADLVADDIVSLDELAAQDKKYGMFLSCIVVRESFRRYGLVEALLAKAVETYLPYKERIADIAIDTVTHDGINFARRYGFKTLGSTEHGSVVHMQSFQDFLEVLSLA